MLLPQDAHRLIGDSKAKDTIKEKRRLDGLYTKVSSNPPLREPTY
jgi:hypothetical protein